MSQKSLNHIAAALLAFAFVGSVGLLYWEFGHDVDASEALEFFNSIKVIPDEENAAYAIAGLAAPPGTKDLHEWGRSEVFKNRDRHMRGEAQIRILSEEPTPDERLFIDLGDEDKKLYCWLPGRNGEGSDEDCMDEAAIRNALERNQVLLRRYKEVFKYPSLSYEPQDYIGVGNAIALTKLLVIQYWINKDNLSENDIATIFRLFRFWERVSRSGDQTMVGTAISLVNYGLATSLITQLSSLNPGILMRYYERYGRFYAERIDEEAFENIARQEFQVFNASVCLTNRLGGKQLPCEPAGAGLTYKPGRTLNMLFEERPEYEDCYGPEKRVTEAGDESTVAFFVRALARPGNFSGRLQALSLIATWEVPCELFDNANTKSEINELYNLYVGFKRKGYSAEQVALEYQENKGSFGIDGTDRFFRWDGDTNSMVLDAGRGGQTYSIPYR
jgi:hypothetical protein